MEGHRRRNKSTNNYCLVQLYITTAGKIYEGPSHIAVGYGENSNENHCEQILLRWVQYFGLPEVFSQYHLNSVNEINILLFSQVRVCDPCQRSFPSWRQQLQQQVGSQPGGSGVRLGLYVWHIVPGSPSGFSPRAYPAGPYTPGPPKPNTTKPVRVRRQDLRQVYP